MNRKEELLQKSLDWLAKAKKAKATNKFKLHFEDHGAFRQRGNKWNAHSTTDTHQQLASKYAKQAGGRLSGLRSPDDKLHIHDIENKTIHSYHTGNKGKLKYLGSRPAGRAKAKSK